jgi:hypothetical protein
MVRTMSGGERRRSVELEELRLMLFPGLAPDEGWRLIDAALERATDRERLERVERLAEDPDLDEELMRTIRRLRSDELTLDLG